MLEWNAKINCIFKRFWDSTTPNYEYFYVDILMQLLIFVTIGKFNVHAYKQTCVRHSKNVPCNCWWVNKSCNWVKWAEGYFLSYLMLRNINDSTSMRSNSRIKMLHLFVFISHHYAYCFSTISCCKMRSAFSTPLRVKKIKVVLLLHCTIREKLH